MYPKITFTQDICSKNFFFFISFFFCAKNLNQYLLLPFCLVDVISEDRIRSTCFCNCPLFESLSPLQVCHVKMGVVHPETVAAVLCYILI